MTLHNTNSSYKVVQIPMSSINFRWIPLLSLTLPVIRGLGVILLMFSCQSLLKKNPSSDQPWLSLDHRSSMQKGDSLAVIQDLIYAGDFERARPLIVEYQEKNPQSQYRVQLEIFLSWCDLSLGEAESASRRLAQLRDGILSYHPKLQAQIHLASSYVHELEGNLSLALASALDAFGQREHLDESQGLTESPARLAKIYGDLGRRDQARFYFEETKEGLEILKSRSYSSLDQDQWARVYYQMGYRPALDLSGFTTEVFEAELQSLEDLNVYHLRSLEYSSSKWSERSLKDLKQLYMGLWNSMATLTTSASVSKNSNLEVWRQDLGLLRDKQAEWMGRLRALVEQMNNYQEATSSFSISPTHRNLNEFFEFVNRLEVVIEKAQAQLARKSPISKESLELNSIFRKGRVIPREYFPNEVENKGSTSKH